MKNLYLVRHAKSSWADVGASDFDRPLNARGKKDAPVMGAHLRAQRGVQVDQVICSTAKRAKTTAKHLLKGLVYPLQDVLWEERIYSGNMQDLVQILKRANDAWQSVMVIGHNPDMTDLVNFLAGDTVDNMPTCGVYAMAFDLDSWGAIGKDCGKRLFFDVPKLI